MPKFLYSLAGSLTALALSATALYQFDKAATSGRIPTTSQHVAANDSGPARTTISDDMPPRSASAPKAQFTEFSRVDLHVSTIGAYEYEPSERIAARANRHETVVHLKRRTWFSLLPTPRAKRAPVVILFHGADRTGLSMLEMWEAAAQRHGVILIAPNSASRRWPYGQPNAGFLETMLTEVDATMPIDRDRVFLFGHSSGAVYAQAMVNQKVGPWRAAATHGGFATSKHLTPAADAKPFRMYIGSLERSFPVDTARQTGQILADAGHPTDLVVIPFQTHWFYDSGPKIAEDAWAWFSAL